ncbi:MAG TPA: SGNH/GDSL hydrolase family protein [Chryseosolibacter sp.]|nr:SGNH/GDSL hydrolase family protein [Chryseosolibacter sp.]
MDGIELPASGEKIKLLALGDSYTIGESVGENERWPVQLMQSLREKGWQVADPKIIATTGWRTDELKNAVLKEDLQLNSDFNLISLLIGVNNQYQGKSVESYKPEFEELLQIAITLSGNNTKRVFVLSIPDYGFTPFGKEKQQVISQAIDQFNNANHEITAKYGVNYIDITPFTRDSDPALLASDALHPAGKMYGIWVREILRRMK